MPVVEWQLKFARMGMVYVLFDTALTFVERDGMEYDEDMEAPRKRSYMSIYVYMMSVDPIYPVRLEC
jgi:hypothetical protein